MTLIDKYADVHLAMVMVLLQVLTKDKLRLVLRFAEFLAKEQAGKG